MLFDSFGRVHNYLRISLTDKCNLRCSYCMPYNLPHGYFAHSNRMNADEVFALASIFVQLGVNKIRLTGGEPLVRKEFRKIIRLLSQLNIEIALSSNGVLIDEFIDDLQHAGIHSVNISLDSLQSDKFRTITQRDYHKRVLTNILLLIERGFDVKVNTVLIRDVNDNEILDLVGVTNKLDLQVRFIEYMPFNGNTWQQNKVVSCNEILTTIEKEFEIESLSTPTHSTSKLYKIKGAKGIFGVISTMSHPFCGDCNRLRLTADGKIKNCLFGKEELDLLTAFRLNHDVAGLILQSVAQKNAVMGGQFKIEGNLQLPIEKMMNRSMVKIGG